MVSSDGEPLIGVAVIRKDGVSGTATDIDGNFSLEVAERETLTFKYLGYTEQTIEVLNRTIIDVHLLESTVKLGEVVIVGYTSIQKGDLTGSVASLEGKELNLQATAQSFDNLLGGQLPGVFVSQTSGRPGEGT